MTTTCCAYSNKPTDVPPEGPRALKAWNELRAAGFSTLSPELGWGGVFALSAEACCGRMEKVTASYYEAPPSWDFGVNPEVVKILDKYGFYAEWNNAAVLCVCEL